MLCLLYDPLVGKPYSILLLLLLLLSLLISLHSLLHIREYKIWIEGCCTATQRHLQRMTMTAMMMQVWMIHLIQPTGQRLLHQKMITLIHQYEL